MSGLRNIVDKIKPTFEKGGKLGFLHSTFDAFETFLFVPNTVTRKGAHVRDCVDLKRIMIIVVLALLPAMLFGIWNTGYQHKLAFGLEDWGFWYGTAFSESFPFTLSHILSVSQLSLPLHRSEAMK